MNGKNAVESSEVAKNKIGIVCSAICMMIVLFGILIFTRPLNWKGMENAGFRITQYNHQLLMSAIAEYMGEHNSEKPQSIYDLSDYVNVDEVLGNPSGATYDISVDSDNNLTLTLTFDGEKLVYTN